MVIKTGRNIMEYDKKIIEQFADKLYKRANSTIITYAFLGVLVGLFLGLADRKSVV